MIKVEDIETAGTYRAIKAMRNAHESWEDSDSLPYALGDADLDLAHRLFDGGPSHRKYARMCFVWMDITAPLYWWKEMDTYRIGKEQNSTSTMHSLHKKELSYDDFSWESVNLAKSILPAVIDTLVVLRNTFIKTKSKEVWREMVQMLPSSYNQMRTVCLSYECCINIIQQRENHKLDEWREFVRILKGLPYMEEFMNGVEEERSLSVCKEG